MSALLATSEFTVGSIPTWLLFALGLFVAWRLSKGGGGSAVTELSEANRVLEKRIHELGAEVRDLRVENEGLKARTDFVAALAPVLEGIANSTHQAEVRQAGIIEGMTHHEERAQDRFRQTTTVLGLIADRLGGDNGN